MKIRAYSDLHLDHYADDLHRTRLATAEEYDPFWYPPELPDDKETNLILAGDLWIGTRWIGYAGWSWINKVAPRFKNVIVVLGNHDYWPATRNDLTIKDGADKCRAMLQDHHLYNVHVLDMSTFTDGDYTFVGATLWTDMNRGDPLLMHRMPQYMRYDGKIAFEHGPNGQWSRFTSEKWIGTHIKHRDFIKHVAKDDPDKKLIVVTHHQPLSIMGDPMYAGSDFNAYYYSDLSDLILENENIAAWICGHSHIQFDQQFEHCRLLMNAVGYVSEGKEKEGLVKHEVIEL